MGHILSMPFLKGTRAHLRFPYASLPAACKTFSHTSGSSRTEGNGRPTWVEVRVEGIGIGGEGCRVVAAVVVARTCAAGKRSGSGATRKGDHRSGEGTRSR